MVVHLFQRPPPLMRETSSQSRPVYQSLIYMVNYTQFPLYETPPLVRDHILSVLQSELSRGGLLYSLLS